MEELLLRFKPGASKPVLLVGGGSFWLIAGLILLIRGWVMLRADQTPAHLFAIAGLVGAIPFYSGVFRKVSLKYAKRIVALIPARPCVFSFINVRGYVIMAFMITFGYWLRSSGVLPSQVVGALYTSIGLPLVISSATFFTEVRHQ